MKISAYNEQHSFAR